MATFLFDLDSTLITVESLEILVKPQLDSQPGLFEQYDTICQQGMNGDISFTESLSRRLQLAGPTLSALQEFCSKPEQWLTQGMQTLFRHLAEQQHDLWIISGGLKPVVLAFATYLDVPESHILAVEAEWSKQGHFAHLLDQNKMTVSKVAGIQQLAPNWQQPVIAIGDGMTDYALYEEGLADYFIAYTEHQQRSNVLQHAEYQASNTQALRQVIEDLLHRVAFSA